MKDNKMLFIIFMIGTFTVGMAEYVVTGLLTQISDDMKVSISSAGLLISVYAISVALIGPLIRIITLKVHAHRLLPILVAIFIISNLVGMSMDKATKYALQLRVIAQESYPNVDRHSFLVEKLRLLIQQLKQSIHHLKQLDDAMIQLAQQLDYFENIHSIPGIGKLSTAMIIGEIGDIKRFKSNKQLNAFVGIDIKRYQSGHTHCRDTINKRGNKKARKLLFWVIMNIIRGQHHYDNHVVDYYYKLRKQPNEKPHKTAIIACINRLLKTIHYLVMNHKLYDYQMSPH